MGLLDFFRKKKRIAGSIGYFDLQDWWLDTLSQKERKYIQEKYQPFGDSTDSLTDCDITSTSQNAVGFLSGLASWFTNKEDSIIAHKILEKAQSLITEKTDIIDKHFLFNQMIKIYYKSRENQEYFNKTIKACEKQIQIAPSTVKAFQRKYKGDPLPSHTGYTQLAIILEKQKQFSKVIELCMKADSEGWAGDWQKRIERCSNRMKIKE